MSQYGAKVKAERGLAAADILAAYYGGIRPTQLRPDQLPPTVRVAVATDQPEVRLGGPFPFRVLDGAGHPLAVISGGQWQVRPAPGGTVEVLPPPGGEEPVALEALGVEGVVGDAAHPPAVRFRVSTLSSVQVTLQGAGTPPVAAPARMVAPGEAVQPLPPVPGPGDYQVVVKADAGGGRVASVPLDFRVEPSGAAALPVEAPAPTAADLAAALPAADVAVPESPPLSTAGTVVAALFVLTIVGAVAVHLVRQANRPLAGHPSPPAPPPARR
jgi:hypothetical protein